MMWGAEDLHSIDQADREGVPDYARRPRCPRIWPSLLDTDEDAWAARRRRISRGGHLFHGRTPTAFVATRTHLLDGVDLVGCPTSIRALGPASPQEGPRAATGGSPR